MKYFTSKIKQNYSLKKSTYLRHNKAHQSFISDIYTFQILSPPLPPLYSFFLQKKDRISYDILSWSQNNNRGVSTKYY